MLQDNVVISRFLTTVLEKSKKKSGIEGPFQVLHGGHSTLGQDLEEISECSINTQAVHT